MDNGVFEVSGIEIAKHQNKMGERAAPVAFAPGQDGYATASPIVDWPVTLLSKDVAGEAQLQGLPRLQATRIAVKAKRRILFVSPRDVIAVQAEGNYVLLVRESGSYLLRESISSAAEKLKPYGFIRIHRSILINGLLVEEIRPRVTGEYGLRMKGGKEYTVTRTYKNNLKSLAEVWIGTDTFLAD